MKKTAEQLRDTIWTTKYGRRVAVRHMADTHLINALRFLEEVYNYHGRNHLLQSVAVSWPRGEAAQDMYDSYIKDIVAHAAELAFELNHDERYRAMQAELKLRGIDYGELFKYDITW